MGDLQDHPHIQRFTGRTNGTQYIVVLMAKIYYSGVLRMYSQIIREKDTHMESERIHMEAS